MDSFSNFIKVSHNKAKNNIFITRKLKNAKTLVVSGLVLLARIFLLIANSIKVVL